MLLELDEVDLKILVFLLEHAADLTEGSGGTISPRHAGLTKAQKRDWDFNYNRYERFFREALRSGPMTTLRT